MSLDQSLDRCAETLAARFPHLDRDIIDRCVHRTYEQLRAHATVSSHLLALTQRRAAEALTARAADAPTDQNSSD